MMHGSYNDYMREFHKQMQRAYPGFPGPFPPPFMGMQFYPPPFMPPPSLGAAGIPVPPTTTKADDIETHAKLVDKFLKNTRHRSHSSGSRSDGGDYSYSEDEGDYSDDSEDNRKSGSRRHARSRSRSDHRSQPRHDSYSRSPSRGGGSEYEDEEDDDRYIQYSSKSAQRRY